LVIPKATNEAFSVLGLAKNALSVGLAPGIAALDIIEAETIKQPRNRDLVLDRKINARRLLAVSERGVEQVDAFKGHDYSGL
jgi:hypothetical protein